MKKATNSSFFGNNPEPSPARSRSFCDNFLALFRKKSEKREQLLNSGFSMEPFSLGWVVKYDGKTLTHLIPMFSELPEDHPYRNRSFRVKSILCRLSRPLVWLWNVRWYIERTAALIIGPLAIIIGSIGVLIQIHDLFCRK